MNVFQQALQEYAQGSNSRVAIAFIVADGVGALFSFFYVLFFGRNYQEIFWVGYFVPLLLLVFAAGFFLAGKLAKQGWEGLIYIVIAVFIFSAAVTSFVVTFVLLKFVF